MKIKNNKKTQKLFFSFGHLEQQFNWSHKLLEWGSPQGEQVKWERDNNKYLKQFMSISPWNKLELEPEPESESETETNEV